MNSKIIRAISLDNLHNRSFGPNRFDLVISGGGFYGFFVVGIDLVLKKLEKLQDIRIQRFAGSSVGAICSIMMCCKIDSLKILDLYERLHGRMDFFFLLREELLKLLPENAYILCSDRVFIHATEIGYFGLRHAVFSQYTSNEDLIDAAMASSNCPLIINPKVFYTYKGKWYIDGCFTRALPYFSPSAGSNQLLIKLYNISYHLPYICRPLDPSIEGLVVKGAIEAEKFLNGRDNITTLEWYGSSKTEKKNGRIYFFGSIIILILCIKYRQSQR